MASFGQADSLAVDLDIGFVEFDTGPLVKSNPYFGRGATGMQATHGPAFGVPPSGGLVVLPHCRLKAEFQTDAPACFGQCENVPACGFTGVSGLTGAGITFEIRP